MKMVPLNVKLVFVVFCSACSGVLVKDFESERERGKSVRNDEGFSSKPGFLGRSAEPSAEKAMELPEFLTIPVSSDHKEDLKPEIGVRQIPGWLQKVLLGIPPTIPQAAAGADESDVIGVRCYLDRLYVRVRREIFRSEDAHKYLTLGSCPVNQGYKEYYYLLYSLKSDCGFKIEVDLAKFKISPPLRRMKACFQSVKPLVISSFLSFRLFYSYKVGFHPKVQGGTVYKKLQANSSFFICPQDASGALITSSKIYNLGDVMHFEASVRDKTEFREKRIYINKCFVTTSPDPYSHPRYTLIDNQGCMMDGKVVTQSKFLSGDSKMIQKFSVGAFIFRQGVSSTSPQVTQFFMHCEVSAGPLAPTPSAKACSYDQASQQWKELYGKDCVCACCESACPSADLPGEFNKSPRTSSPLAPGRLPLVGMDLRKKSVC
uniref:Zona pellucida glycoprotein 3c n=1 Tax=Nothobranchius furzeri TaxID=105023 RepID=A0A8C6K597_NOTFU